MGRDWHTEIAQLAQIKRAIYRADTAGLWNFHLPKPGASESELAAAEAHLGFRLDPDYRSFLSTANGWDAFHQTVDLFGTEDLMGSQRFRAANDMLEVTAPIVSEHGNLERDEVTAIAATTEDVDTFVMAHRGGQQGPVVVWLAGREIERYDSFKTYVQTMIRYNMKELEELARESPA